MIEIDTILLVGAVVLIAAIIAARIGARIGLPSLLLFLGLGLVMGESGIGISFDNADLARALAFAALVVILAEGGLTTRWSDIRSSTVLAALLATVGVLISVGLMTLFGHYVLGLPLWVAVLLGAVTSPTDAAAVFSVLRTVPIPRSLRGALEAESGLNDAPTVLLVMLASSYAVGNPVEFGIPGLFGLILLEMIGGLAIGGGLGWLGAQILRRVALPSSGLYPLAILVWTVFAYGITALIHASGFAAVYVCALVLGNLQLPHRAATRSFVEGIGWIAQIGLFVMLGLLAFPDRVTPQAALIAVSAGPGPDPGCPARLQWWLVRCGSRSRSGIRCFSPGQVCVERCRSCWPQFRWLKRSRAPSSFSMWCWSLSSSSPVSRVQRCRWSPACWAWWTMGQRKTSKSRLRRSTRSQLICCRFAFPQSRALRGSR